MRINSINYGTRDIAGTIPIFKNSIVLVTNKNGKYIFPKGGVKHNETTEHAALRETLEESGCIGKLIGNKIEVMHGDEKRIYYKMKVDKIRSDFPERQKRKVLVVHPQDALKNKHVSSFTKTLIKIAM